MQNDELRRAQVDLASARDRYVDLYDFAPVGYLTLNREDRIVEANLTAAALLDTPRASLLGRHMGGFIASADADRWQHHLNRAFQSNEPSRIELRLRSAGAGDRHGQLDGLRVTGLSGEPALRIVLTDITQRWQFELTERLAAKSAEAREAERRRVARELHEDLGQRLSALKMNLATLCDESSPPARHLQVSGMLENLDDAVATIRRIVAELRPLVLDDLGFNAAIEWLARDCGRRLGLQVSLRLDDADPPLGEGRAIGLFRWVQDALAHIAHHQHATEARLQVRQAAAELTLSIEANGSGWPHPHVGVGAAPADAEEALQAQALGMGGQMDSSPLASGGRHIVIRLPLASPAAPNDSSTLPGPA